jgi:hypothetical protein
MLERPGQRGDGRGLVVGHFEKGIFKSIAGRAAEEHEPPGLDVGVRRRVLGQGECLFHQLLRHRPR